MGEQREGVWPLRTGVTKEWATEPESLVGGRRRDPSEIANKGERFRGQSQG